MRINLHLVSDSTGETVHSIYRACMAQFEGVDVAEHSWPLIRTKPQLVKILDSLVEAPGVILYTLVDPELASSMKRECALRKIPCIPVLDPVIGSLSRFFGVKAKGQPGRQHVLDAEYFGRIDAMQFALAHDDGQATWNLGEADVVLIGVSRTSKSPTCLYLANRGIKAANVPFVPGVAVPESLLSLDPETGPMVVGLTKDPERLVQIRRNRLRMMAESDDTDYVDLETVRAEVTACRRLCNEKGWVVIDVTRRSIEETATTIMTHLNRRHVQEA